MKIFRAIRKLIKPAANKELLSFNVKCARCREVIEIKIRPAGDLMNQYKDAGEPGPAYILKKEILGNRCNNLMRMTVEFDSEYNIISKSVEGGEIILQ